MGASQPVQGVSRARLLAALAVSLALVAGTLSRVAWAKSGPKECPEMTNPGGGLDWEPSKDPGPDPTSYKVELPTMGRTQPIVRVGIDKDRRMVVPKNARDVAWLDQGPIPGRTRNVVLAGHINYSGQRGSFEGIGRMKKREDIYLVLKNGKKMHFKVAWVCTFPKDTPHAAQIMGNTKVTSVTLVSCGGTYDRSAGTHDKRVVVRGELYPPAKSSSSKPKPKATPKPTPKPTPTPTPDLLERLIPPLP
jgi:sortase (surface protein transpeptidase)